MQLPPAALYAAQGNSFDIDCWTQRAHGGLTAWLGGDLPPPGAVPAPRDILLLWREAVAIAVSHGENVDTELPEAVPRLTAEDTLPLPPAVGPRSVATHSTLVGQF